jgi:hypothetical protein
MKKCLLHKWNLDHISGINKYYQCKKCDDRKVSWPKNSLGNATGYSPIDFDWIKRR